ncbi:MAG TPA: glucose 1-dehydrogenase [Stellaceae bacterium]|nr:glucose 1-dehydrogenase [Stellaceae bacterium]
MTSRDGRLTGKVALVTGGGSGIGRATALVLAGEGAAVVVSNRRASLGQETVDMIHAAGRSGAFQAADVTRPEDVQTLVDFTVDRFGRLDIAFNNAGAMEPRALLHEQTLEMFDMVFDTNVRGVFLCMRSEIDQMLKGGGGVIVNCGSVSGIRNANPGISAYSAAKCALHSLTRSAAMEYAAKGIRINAVAPGRILTDMLANAGVQDLESFANGLPMRRLGRPEEIAETVIWLASDAASFVTGQVVGVDGGFLAQ